MKTSLSLVTVALGLAGLSGQAWSTQVATTSHRGMSEIGDQELAQMRGRYTPPGNTNTVAYFGVTMSSNWNATSGQQLSSTMQMAMTFNAAGQAQVTFQPTVTIVQTTQPATSTDAATPANRTVDSSGLRNTSGLVQGVQIAGDSNVADNVTSLSVSNEGESAATPTAQGVPYSGQAQTFTAQSGDATATSSISDRGIQVSVSVAGQGQVQQWINGGSLGQVISLGTDGQSVHNTLQIQLVQRALASNVSLNRDLSQSLNQIRGFGMSY